VTRTAVAKTVKFVCVFIPGATPRAAGRPYPPKQDVLTIHQDFTVTEASAEDEPALVDPIDLPEEDPEALLKEIEGLEQE